MGAETPRTSADRRVMKRAAAKAAEKLGVSNAELQAVLWYHEQHLWRLFGAKNDSADFADAGKDALQHHGFNPSVAEEGGVDGPKQSNARPGKGVPRAK